MGAVLFILLLSFLCTVSSLLIYVVAADGPNTPHNITVQSTTSLPETNYTPVFLESFYSTMGTRPVTNIFGNISLLSTKDINGETCILSSSVNILDRMVVFTDANLPPLPGCNTHFYGRSAALARILQGKGARGLIFASNENVCVVLCL
jgi:hypothetical protein